MVDMDPSRRELASKAIEEFAKDQQVLVMTCHPNMMDLFLDLNLLKLNNY